MWLTDGSDDLIRTRLDFLNYSQKDNLWFMIDHPWKKISWNVEPKESIEELCKRRAEQLRDKYDYIVLYYSGGPDSSTVLNTFRDNNIPLDEIVFYNFSDIGSLGTDTVAKEQVNGLNVVDINQNVLNKIFDKELWERENYNFTGLIHDLARFRIDFYEKVLGKGKIRKGNVCHLMCGDYPKIRVRSITRTEISFDHIFTARKMIFASNTYGNEQFYTSVDMPELNIKQSHLLAKYFKQKYGTKLFDRIFYVNLELTDSFITESVEEKRDSGLRKLPAIFFKSYKKAGGDLNRMLLPGTECREIMEVYRKDREFIDKYKGAISQYKIDNNILSSLYEYLELFRWEIK